MSYPDPSLDDLASDYHRQLRHLTCSEEELADAEQELAQARAQVSLKASKVASAVEGERGAWKKLVKARAEANPEKMQPLEVLLADSSEKV